jgi:hypothetical protein
MGENNVSRERESILQFIVGSVKNCYFIELSFIPPIFKIICQHSAMANENDGERSRQKGKNKLKSWQIVWKIRTKWKEFAGLFKYI